MMLKKLSQSRNFLRRFLMNIKNIMIFFVNIWFHNLVFTKLFLMVMKKLSVILIKNYWGGLYLYISSRKKAGWVFPKMKVGEKVILIF